MSAANILVVEDDLRLAALLQEELSQAGYQVVAVHAGTDALSAIDSQDFDLVVLDLNLPDIDGIDVAERLKGISKASIIMLTARGSVENRVEGLYAGASDYLTKPFSVQELLARVHVRLREREPSGSVIKLDAIELDTAASSCLISGEHVLLTAQEYKLLELLLVNRGRIYAKEDLEDRLYGADLPGSNTIEVFVSNLRKKLASHGVTSLIQTVRGMGYVIR